jgi:hypothetical protein
VKNIALQYHFNTHAEKWEDLNAAYNKMSKVTKPRGNPKSSTSGMDSLVQNEAGAHKHVV